MKIIVIIIAGMNKKYLMNAPSKTKVSEIIGILSDYLGIGEYLLYHIESGRFLYEAATLDENGVESGDRLLFLMEKDSKQ